MAAPLEVTLVFFCLTWNIWSLSSAKQVEHAEISSHLLESANEHNPPKHFSVSLRFASQNESRLTLPLRFSKHGQPPKRSIIPPMSYANHTNFASLKRSRDNYSLLRANSAAYSVSVCPPRCNCSYLPSKVLDIVDCSYRGLKHVPELPVTTRELYLYGNEIRDIPCTAFGSLWNLAKLDLSRNYINTLSNCSFANLASLEQLWLTGNQFESLSVGPLYSMENLLYLDLSKNSLTKIENDTFQNLSSLVFLSLQGNKLRYLPRTFEVAAFRGLTSLESLHLEGNQPDLIDKLTYPDQALAQVPTLKRLWLDGYPKALGPGFSSLVKLSYINFAGHEDGFCSFQSDMPPRFFFHLTTRQPLNLSLSACSLSALPSEVFAFVPTIYNLDLSNNRDLSIDGFEKASEGLQNSTIALLDISQITQLSWSYTLIKNTSFRFLKHTRLKALAVEDCYLDNIDPQAIIDLPQTLEYISFRTNGIWKQYAFITMAHLRNLKTVVLSNQMYHTRENHNSSYESLNLTGSGHIFTTHTDKETLPFSDTYDSAVALSDTFQADSSGDVQEPQQSLGDTCRRFDKETKLVPLPPRLESYYHSHVKLDNIVNSITFINGKILKYLDMSSNSIKYLYGPICGLPSLQYLDLSKNFCANLSPNFLSTFLKLRILLLNQNMLGQSLAGDVEGKIFSTLTLLEVLDISANVLENLPGLAFINNKNLRILNISNNELTQFRPSLVNNKKLETLDLSANLLTGLSQSTCNELQNIKRNSPNFTVWIKDNKFLCDCNNFYFLTFLLNQPEIFEDVNTFRCQLQNGLSLGYDRLADFLPQLSMQCMVQSIFLVVLVSFFLISGALVVCGLYHFKRWQWKYLYYVGKSRLHIGSTYLTFRHVAHTFVTYDQENYAMRRLMRTVALPRLHGMGITTVLGETDFGFDVPLVPSIAGAVTGTGKTLVFLSPDIFQDHYRQLEVNLAIMHELHLRRPVLVPVVMLGVEKAARLRNRGLKNAVRARRHQSEYVRFMDLLVDFPPEISTFLEGQIHRCIVYYGDTESFWKQLKAAILEE